MKILQILQGLASNDHKIKEDNFVLLSNYLVSQPPLKEEGLENRFFLYKKVWNAIFYFFYNVDKPLNQKKKAEEIAFLINNIRDKDLYMLVGIQVFNNKWSKIDFFRIDKYIMLMDCIYKEFFNYCYIKKKFNKIKRFFEGIKQLATKGHYLKIDNSDNENKDNNLYKKIVLSNDNNINNTNNTFRLHFNYSFLRNLAKNIGCSIPLIFGDLSNNVCRLSLKNFIQLYGILPKKECEMFGELVITNIIKHIKLNEEFKTEFKVLLEDLDLTSKNFTNLSKKVIENIINKYLKKSQTSSVINLSDSLDNDDNSQDEVLSKNTSNKYIIDPLYDDVLKKNYFTKFRLSNVERLNLLSKRNKALKEIKHKDNIINKSINDDKDVKIDLIDETITLNSNNNNTIIKEEAVFDDNYSEDSIEIIKKDRKSSINSAKSNNSSKNSKSSNNNILYNPKKTIVENSKLNTSKTEESNIYNNNSTNNKSNKCININKVSNKFNEEDDESLSSISESIELDKITPENNKSNINNSNKNNTKNLDLEETSNNSNISDNNSYENEEELLEYEEEDDDNQYYMSDYYEEGEEDDNFDDFENMEDIDDFDPSSMKNLKPNQRMFLAQLFAPPDFKKDLFKKNPKESEEGVDYKSLKAAIENSKLNSKKLSVSKANKFLGNMINLTKKVHKKLMNNNKHLANEYINNPNYKKKLKFNLNLNTKKVFNLKKTVLLEFDKSKEMKKISAPLKGCLKINI